MVTKIKNRNWLTLGQASEFLGVHATTLRRWADEGELPVMMTPGGHRRFLLTDLERAAQKKQALQHNAQMVEIWADKALAETRHQVASHGHPVWMDTLDDTARERNRLLGQQLMGLTLQYLSQENGVENILDQAQELGREYAQNALRMGLPLSQVLQAAIFFRDTLVETALQLPENARLRPGANLQLMRRVNKLLNVVHLAIAEEYDVQ